jgi:hypothetical protein
MANPLFNRFGPKSAPGPIGNVANILQQYQQFKSTFQGDPKQKIQEMLDNGQITQEQLNQVIPVAQQLANLLGKH